MLGQTAAGAGKILCAGVEQVRFRIATQPAVTGVLLNCCQNGLELLIDVHGTAPGLSR